VWTGRLVEEQEGDEAIEGLNPWERRKKWEWDYEWAGRRYKLMMQRYTGIAQYEEVF
jgi:hypothetical protein